MSMFWIVLALAAPPSEGVASAAVTTPPSPIVDASAVPQRSGKELGEAARTALRRWARTSDKDADAAAREFLVVYRELQQDSRLGAKQREELRNKVRGRLAHLALQISKRDAKESKLAKDGPKSVAVAKRDGVLAQVNPGNNQGGFGGGNGMMGGGMGGGMGGIAQTDAGDDLVDLIQKTISPTTWDVNGGPGAIYDWRPQRALVVTAPDEVHEQLIDLMEQMERMNR